MRLVDFLILILETHGQVLQRLAALFSEEILVELLERMGDELENAEPAHPKPLWSAPGKIRGMGGSALAYSELETAVQNMKLPSMLQFHLWAYPHYRAFIESSMDLNSRIQEPGSENIVSLVDEALAQAETWIRQLPLPPELAPQAERASQVAWVRFRTTVLKRVGKRPFETI